MSRGAERNESNEMSRILSQTAKGVIPRLNLPQKGLHRHRTSYAGVTNTDRTDRRPMDSNENDSSRLSSEGPSRHLHTYKSATQRFGRVEETNQSLQFQNQVRQMNKAATASLVKTSEETKWPNKSS